MATVVAGGGTLQSYSVQVTSAEILTLHTNPVVLVPAIAGAVITPSVLVMQYVYGTAAYVDPGGHLVIGTPQLAWTFQGSAGFWDQTHNLTSIFAGEQFASTDCTDAQMRGLALQLSQNTGNPTTGDGVINVTTYYVATVLA